MKHLKFYTTLFLTGLLFPVLSFTQITNDYLLQNAANFPPNLFESSATENSRPSLINHRDANDLLLAERGDTWLAGGWDKTDSTEYYYDSDNLLTERVSKVFDGNWVDDVRTNYTYDANGNETLRLIENWDGSNWINDRQITQEYNADNAITLSSYQNWDGSNWINDSQWLSLYNLSDSIYISMRQDWDGSNWVDAVRNTWYNYYDYSLDNITSLVQQFWNTATSEWDNNLRLTIEYGLNNEVIQRLFESWDGTDWFIDARGITTYDANLNEISYLREVFDGVEWSNSQLITYGYDANNNQTSFLFQLWSNNDWNDFSGSLYEYDAYNNRTLRIAQSSDGISLVNSSRYIYYYQIVSSTSQPKLEHPVQLFPNPANQQLTIDLGDNKILSGQLNIYNMMGHLLRTQPLEGSKQVTLELNGFSAGTYYLQILDGERQTTRTFMVAP